MTARQFDIGDIASVITGRLINPGGLAGIYELLNYMTGDSIYTHQTRRAVEACSPALRAQHPRFAVWKWSDNGDLIPDDLRLAREFHGDTLPVEPLDDWHHIDPIQELAEMTERPDLIVTVSIDDSAGES